MVPFGAFWLAVVASQIYYVIRGRTTIHIAFGMCFNWLALVFFWPVIVATIVWTGVTTLYDRSKFGEP